MSASRSAAIANIDAGVVGGAVGDTIGVGDTATFGGDAVGDTALDIGKGDTRGINISLFCCGGTIGVGGDAVGDTIGAGAGASGVGGAIGIGGDAVGDTIGVGDTATFGGDGALGVGGAIGAILDFSYNLIKSLIIL